MSVFIVAVHMEPSDSNRHEHIASVRWMKSGSTETTTSTRAQMVEWIQGGGDAWVADGQGAVQVGVVDATPPYLRTFADDRPTDNLLSLPRF